MSDNKHTPETADIHSLFNACMFRGHCKELEAQRDKYAAALNEIACWEQGPVNGRMDEPAAAKVARDALGSEQPVPDFQEQIDQQQKVECEMDQAVKGVEVDGQHVSSRIEDAGHDRDAGDAIPVVGFPALVFYPCGSLGEPIESEGGEL